MLKLNMVRKTLGIR